MRQPTRKSLGLREPPACELREASERVTLVGADRAPAKVWAQFSPREHRWEHVCHTEDQAVRDVEDVNRFYLPSHHVAGGWVAQYALVPGSERFVPARAPHKCGECKK